MIDKLPSLVQLLKNLQHVPYLASKNIYRVADHFLHMDYAKAEQFCDVILQAKQKLKQCSVCYAWQERDQDCMFCAAIKRDQKVVCVVETWQELLAIEKTGGYNGVFHVLGGVICPLDGVGPDDLTINALVRRVENGVGEVILAMNQTPEGEATSAYIANKLRSYGISISCLARGLPVGSSLETMDRLTVYKALSERRPF
jgi:recombination protein RecR